MRRIATNGAPSVLGRVDGFNQHQPACKTDDGGVADVGLFAAHGDALEPLELADGLFDARPEFIETLGKEPASLLGVFTTGDHRGGITGVMPRASAATRFAWLSYPLSVIAMRGRMSGPMSSDVSNCVLSLASPGVRWKSRGRPSRSVLRWIFVEKPPRERPRA